MITIYFAGYDGDDCYRECRFSSNKIEYSLDALTVLVSWGWQLRKVTIQEGKGLAMPLPVEAFDGNSFEKPIDELRQVWEGLLIGQF